MRPNAVCLNCEHGAGRLTCQGPCPCLADPERRDILVHISNAQKGEPSCPLHRHDNIDPGSPPSPPEPVKPIPRSEWPIWAKGFALLANKEDIGIGSTIERMIGTDNSEAFKVWYKATFGTDCGCSGRKAQFDQLYPYANSPTQPRLHPDIHGLSDI